MKKQYISPTADIVTVGIKASILTGSNVVAFGTDNDGEATSEDDNLSRRHYTVWDEEDDDEEELY